MKGMYRNNALQWASQTSDDLRTTWSKKYGKITEVAERRLKSERTTRLNPGAMNKKKKSIIEVMG